MKNDKVLHVDTMCEREKKIEKEISGRLRGSARW